MSTGSQEYVSQDSPYQQSSPAQRRQQQLGVLLLLAGLLMLFQPQAPLLSPFGWLSHLPFFSHAVPAHPLSPPKPPSPRLHSEPHHQFGPSERAHPRGWNGPLPGQSFSIPDGAYAGEGPLPPPQLEQRWEYR